MRIQLPEAAIRAAPAHCLLTDEELALRPEGWATLPDPIAPWIPGEVDGAP